jgi:hypothetical protein
MRFEFDAMAASFGGFPCWESGNKRYFIGNVLYSNEEGGLLVMGNLQKTLYLKGKIGRSSGES